MERFTLAAERAGGEINRIPNDPSNRGPVYSYGVASLEQDKYDDACEAFENWCEANRDEIVEAVAEWIAENYEDGQQGPTPDELMVATEKIEARLYEEASE